MTEVIVLFEYEKQQEDELTLKVGEVISNVKQVYDGWCEGTLNGVRGMFPDNFVQLRQPTANKPPPPAPVPVAAPPEQPPNISRESKKARRAKVTYSYVAENPDELNLQPGQVVEVVEEEEEGWWRGRMDGKEGLFPSNFVEMMENGDKNAPSGPADTTPPPKEKPRISNSDPSSSVIIRERHSKPEKPPSKPPEKQVEQAKVLFDYAAEQSDELTIKVGEVLEVVSKELDGQEGWWEVRRGDQTGLIPDNFVELLPPSQPPPDTKPPPPTPGNKTEEPEKPPEEVLNVDDQGSKLSPWQQEMKARKIKMACNGGVQKMSNGREVAKCVPRKESGFREHSGNIAAIDFGTTNCSVAYITVGSGSEDSPRRLPLNTTYHRVPTAILFKPDGSIASFGYDAHAEYLNLENEDRLHYAYFEEIKMNLQHDMYVNREMKIKAKNGKDYYLVDLIAQVLKYLKIELIENHLKRGGHPLEATDFDWVITVPAIWRARGKQMMREAGYKAGLCSQETCGNLREASVLCPMLPNEKDPDKLSLALEPECAAIYCQTMSSRQQVATYCQAEMPYHSTCYLVVDIGGGTVDISAHRLSPTQDRHVQVVHPPTGNDCGGSKVNKNFENFLESLVHDKGFSKYLQSKNPATNAKHSADLNELVNRIFEYQKVIFGRRGGVGLRPDSKLTIRLPFSFIDMYKDDINNGIKRIKGSRLKLVDQDLRIGYSLMADFFQPVVEGMLECMSQTLREIEAKINTIYVVGGFGGSQYIYTRISERFRDTYRYITPLEPDFAVVRGAVLFRQNPDIVHARKVDATYGVRTNISFDPQIHDTEYKWINDDGEEKCSNIFCTVVERGDLVRTEEVFSKEFGPAMHQQTNASFEIYSTLEKDVRYTTGKRGKGSQDTAPVELRKIGAFVVQMPVLTGDKNRRVDVTFDFSHTEIQVRGYDRTSGNEVKVTLDFLSA